METTENNELHLGDATKRVASRMIVIVENRLQTLIGGGAGRTRTGFAGNLAWAGCGGVWIAVRGDVDRSDRRRLVGTFTRRRLAGAGLDLPDRGGGFYSRLVRLQRDWQTLPGTLDQLKKDRECLEKNLI